MRRRRTDLLLSCLTIVPLPLLTGINACEDPSVPSPAEDWSRDLLTTSLQVDVSTMTARATIEVVPSETSTGLSLEASGIAIDAVALDDGTALNWREDPDDGSIDIGLPTSASILQIDYTFRTHFYTFDGYMVSGDTFIWPDYCGNLFPCHSDPADGLRFSVEVTGLEADEIAVAPASLTTLEGPSYQLGFTVGRYTRHDLGVTPAGTRVVFFSLPDDDPQDIASGTAHFRDYVETLEQHFGPYPFGPEMGAKTVLWCATGNCEYAGMEEHPYFDVSDGSIHDPTVFAHEASHAWFGDGVRLECWGEDLVLSEGSASYLEIALIGLVEGEAAAQEVVTYYRDWLSEEQAAGADAIVWPETCDEVDTYDIWYSVTYARGALFWYDVEQEVGRAALMRAFGDFLDVHLGRTAHMSDLLDTVHASTGFDPWPLAEVWLRSLETPASSAR